MVWVILVVLVTALVVGFWRLAVASRRAESDVGYLFEGGMRPSVGAPSWWSRLRH